ncbi:MAG: molybdate ABC transporter substrate-binding protein, partial [Candidatus Nitrotoga sp.]|nr:molybdate ABC transporter substrate-binding protein [Candidatus Nitrotoga sp.]
MRVTIKSVRMWEFVWVAVAVIVYALSLSIAMAEHITIAVAASMKPAMADIVRQFNARHPKDEVRAIYGSSGKLAAQIQSGAPFDMFFSADLTLPTALQKEGWGATDPVVYAVGRLVIWSSTTDATRLTLEKLAEPAMRKIAIANPARAPYGMRAKEALVSA